MKIRGGKMANVLILIDGVPFKDVTGNDYNAVDLRLFASENIESIEILSGASSVLYGSNATVSVINIKTKKNSQKTIEGRIGARIGSFGTFSQNGIVNGKIDKFTYQVSVLTKNLTVFLRLKDQILLIKMATKNKTLMQFLAYNLGKVNLISMVVINIIFMILTMALFLMELTEITTSKFWWINANYQYKKEV
jgi:hypothetical protein